jgi:catechol 2,3-dioxygenase-like lactoylglutathione lyase family enzyme
MKRVTGIGGIFFKADDPKAMNQWYQKHLGIDLLPDGSCAIFPWLDADDPEKEGMTVWTINKRDTTYYGGGPQTFMVNYRVENLDELVETLKSEGVWVDEKRDNSDFGKFAWIKDPEGNRIELWEPPKGSG